MKKRNSNILDTEIKITKTNVVKHFKENVYPEVVKTYGKDKQTMGQAWAGYINFLKRLHIVTQKQAEKWGNPFYR